MAKVILDTVNVNESEFVKFLDGHGIDREVKNPRGPGGGSAIVEYKGEKRQLTKMIDEFWGGDKFLKSMIEA